MSYELSEIRFAASTMLASRYSLHAKCVLYSLLFILSVFQLQATALGQTSRVTPIRPPAVPLVACDPYFSIWSQADQLNETATTHWTGKPHRIESQLVVDGKAFDIIGDSGDHPQARQTGLQVLPTRTIYQFETDTVALELTFCTPALPYDMDLLSWPVTYITYRVQARDESLHDVQVRFFANRELAVNSPEQETNVQKVEMAGLKTLQIGSVAQPILANAGDDIRIDWGHLYLSAPQASTHVSREGGSLELSLKAVGMKPQSTWLMLAYDDLYSIQYMMQNLRPYWRRNGREASDLLLEAARRYAELSEATESFDTELMADLEQAGGREYAWLAALSYRQCFAAGKFVADKNGQPLQFSKENHSNGCIATSDVFYPMSPQFLLFGPTLAKSFVVPFMNYAASPRWKFPFAPHDLGTYPHANGQVYGGGETSEENQMPVEESGNMLILMAAIAQMEGHADFAGLYWTRLSQWADYLKDKGFDPENQLCTDDFAGHMAHNVNLSAKAIMGLGAYAKLCQMRGETERAESFRKLAQSFADRWVSESADGDHYRLAFDRPGTWSQKYNLIWDRILDLNLFPRQVAETEMAYYRRIQNEFGLPLDNRSDYTKLDWITWTATLTQDKEDFKALISPIIGFINETPDRSPLTDWYFTSNAKKRGFTARPVVGGVFAQMLYDAKVWKKWSARDVTNAEDWAKMPRVPEIVPIVPAADREPGTWRYTMARPDSDWKQTDFNAESWENGKAGFGTEGTPGVIINTPWKTADIWLVRDIEISEDPDLEHWRWYLHHDEAAEIYLNGQRVLSVQGWSTKYQLIPISELAANAMKKGRNRIAIHCHQTSGGQYIDLGIVKLEEANE